MISKLITLGQMSLIQPHLSSRKLGVAEKYRSSLAAFLCAAYIEKQPIFLVGPNAIDIVQAFSAAITGHKYGMLCCEGGYCNQVITEIGTDGEDIVIINNLLASGWMNRLPEILSQKDIFYVATHPYAEDIQVEPKSLYGFMLPLFTEFLWMKKLPENTMEVILLRTSKPTQCQRVHVKI